MTNSSTVKQCWWNESVFVEDYQIGCPFHIIIIREQTNKHLTRTHIARTAAKRLFLRVDKYEPHNFRQFGNEQSVSVSGGGVVYNADFRVNRLHVITSSIRLYSNFLLVFDHT